MDPEIVETIKKALLALGPGNPEHRKILEMAHFQKIIPAADPDFDSVRDLSGRVWGRADD